MRASLANFEDPQSIHPLVDYSINPQGRFYLNNQQSVHLAARHNVHTLGLASAWSFPRGSWISDRLGQR